MVRIYLISGDSIILSKEQGEKVLSNKNSEHFGWTGQFNAYSEKEELTASVTKPHIVAILPDRRDIKPEGYLIMQSGLKIPVTGKDLKAFNKHPWGESRERHLEGGGKFSRYYVSAVIHKPPKKEPKSIKDIVDIEAIEERIRLVEETSHRHGGFASSIMEQKEEKKFKKADDAK